MSVEGRVLRLEINRDKPQQKRGRVSLYGKKTTHWEYCLEFGTLDIIRIFLNLETAGYKYGAGSRLGNRKGLVENNI